MATHSSILAWRIPWTEEPDGLTRSQWGHKESDGTEQLHILFTEPPEEVGRNRLAFDLPL